MVEDLKVCKEVVNFVRNPLHGVESGFFKDFYLKAVYGIHYMELKVINVTDNTKVFHEFIESITWN